MVKTAQKKLEFVREGFTKGFIIFKNPNEKDFNADCGESILCMKLSFWTLWNLP